MNVVGIRPPGGSGHTGGTWVNVGRTPYGPTGSWPCRGTFNPNAESDGDHPQVPCSNSLYNAGVTVSTRRVDESPPTSVKPSASQMVASGSLNNTMAAATEEALI